MEVKETVTQKNDTEQVGQFGRERHIESLVDACAGARVRLNSVKLHQRRCH